MHLAPLLYLIFFLSGASALVFETLWFFQAGLALGNSIWASSLVLASFMAGLALGNAWVSFRGDRLQRPVRLYAGLELVIAITGTVIVFSLPAITPTLAPWLGPLLDQPLPLNLLRTSVGFALMLIPATAMGATLPLLVSALYHEQRRFGQALGGLYGWNTLGAVCGVLTAEILLIEHFGIRGTALVAAAGNTTAALLSLAVDRLVGPGTAPSAPEAPRPAGEKLAKGSGWILASAFLLGALLLALEVVWFRFLILFVAGTAYTFAVMLAVVLAGIGSGGLVAARWLGSGRQASAAIPLLCLLAGMLCLWLYIGFEAYSPLFTQGATASLPRILGLAIPLMFPVAAISGILFTLLGEVLHSKLGGETRSAGLLTLANTLGAALGSLLAGFLLLPALGVEKSLFVLGLGYAGAAGIVTLAGIRPGTPRNRRVLQAGLVLFALTALLFPHGILRDGFLVQAVKAHAPRARIVAVREGLTETIVYARHEIFGEPYFYRLITNNHSMSASSLAAQRYMKLFVYMPIAFHEAPRKALLISYGVGATARALVDSSELESIDMVDISRDILEMSRDFVSQGRESLNEIVMDSPLDDPRVRVHVEDGRFFLQTTPERFDLITGEPPPPKLAGIVNLYTREYFQLIRDRLAEGGITTYWLPVHSLLEDDAKAILRAFCDVFEDCTLWNGAGLDWIMMGSRDRSGPTSRERIVAQWNDSQIGPEMVALGIEHPEQLGALFMADADQISEITRETLPLTDDFPRRLSTDVRVSDYRLWMDVDQNRQRLIESRGLDAILPADLREQSLDFFEAQRDINRHFGVRDPKSNRKNPRRLPPVHAMMEDLDLRTLPLWLLEGDYDYVRAAQNVQEKFPNNPKVHYALAIWALTHQDWATAEEHFQRASQQGRANAYLPLRAYALCRGGKLEEGRRLSSKFQRTLREPDSLTELLNEVCATPPAQTPASD
ncbi:MAG: spermidine synthase [Myxococcota bacterium]|nr:spermidine synthase [Myxococcota bacterium]